MINSELFTGVQDQQNQLRSLTFKTLVLSGKEVKTA